MSDFSPILPSIFKQFPHLVAFQTTRSGGNSQGNYASMNLGKNTADDPAIVQSNYAILKQKTGIDAIAISHQIHGEAILIAENPGKYEGYDAIITQKKGLLIGVTIADCCPILIYDAKNEAVAAVHAGWKGTIYQLVLKTLKTMQATYHTHPTDCFVFVGACISERNFEVGDEVADHFSKDYKTFNPARGKYIVDLKKANAAQCLSFGIPTHQIEISPLCTYESDALLFSHRKSGGITGRMLGGIGMVS